MLQVGFRKSQGLVMLMVKKFPNETNKLRGVQEFKQLVLLLSLQFRLIPVG